MPQGKGTYGSQVGRPKKYKKGGKTKILKGKVKSDTQKRFEKDMPLNPEGKRKLRLKHEKSDLMKMKRGRAWMGDYTPTDEYGEKKITPKAHKNVRGFYGKLEAGDYRQKKKLKKGGKIPIHRIEEQHWETTDELLEYMNKPSPKHYAPKTMRGMPERPSDITPKAHRHEELVTDAEKEARMSMKEKQARKRIEKIKEMESILRERGEEPWRPPRNEKGELPRGWSEREFQKGGKVENSGFNFPTFDARLRDRGKKG